MINNMEKELKHGLMVLHMKEIISKGKNMDLEYLSGMMEVCMKENFRKI